MTASLRVAQPALDLGLLLRARAQLGGDALALGAVGGELGLERLERAWRSPRADLGRAPRRARCACGSSACSARELAGEDEDPARALGPLARGALGDAALGRRARPAAARGAPRASPCVGLLAALRR